VFSAEDLRARWHAIGESQGLRIAVARTDGRPVFGSVDKGLTLLPGETRLPFMLSIGSSSQAPVEGMVFRRGVLVGGIALVCLLMTAASYGLYRVTTRELRLARQQSDFVAAVSHEFRTPLTSLRKLTEILIDERITSDDRRRTYYRALERQTDRLHRLVESLLDFGRMEAGTSPYRLAPLDAVALVRGVVSEFADDPASRGSDIVLGDMPAEVPVAGDRDALRNLLWNLLDNAVKYSPEQAAVRVDVTLEGDRVLVGVRDQGHGIPAAEHESIFDPFVRGSLAKVENIQGTGIGLAMVRHIARAHGGDVHVESAPGQGSAFIVSLPVIAGPAADVAPHRAAV
jgi:signal transduction histidine kinase